MLGFHTVHHSPMFGASAPIDAVVRATAAAGFDAIGFDLPSLDAADAAGWGVDRVADLLGELGLACSDVLVVAVGSDPDPVATARRLATVGARLGATVCVGAVAAPLPFAELVRVMTAAAGVLADADIRLAVEFNPSGALTSLAAAVELRDAVGADRLGLVLDTLHLSRTATPPDQVLALDAGTIALVQVSDAPAERPADLIAESRHRRLLPGDGALDPAAWLATIAATGYRGAVTAEVLSAELRSTAPEIVTARCAAAMRSQLPAS